MRRRTPKPPVAHTLLNEEAPEPPTNVRWVHDGQEIPLELTYDGLHNGIHCWIAWMDVHLGPEDRILADVIPARTSIAVKIAPPL